MNALSVFPWNIHAPTNISWERTVSIGIPKLARFRSTPGRMFPSPCNYQLILGGGGVRRISAAMAGLEPTVAAVGPSGGTWELGLLVTDLQVTLAQEELQLKARLV